MIKIGNFECSVLRHSITERGHEAFSVQFTSERFFHAEVIRHRQASPCFSSSRAIPYAAMNEWTERDLAMPLHFGSNRPGMQPGDEVEDADSLRAEIRDLYRTVRSVCDRWVVKYNPHKEIINRYLEPWGWITGTMTFGRPSLMNLFSLRCSPQATPNFQRCVVNIARLYRDSEPQILLPGQWHTPYYDSVVSGDTSDPAVAEALIWSSARAAWCSYNNPTKDATFEKAKKRHDDCVAFKHMTPLEPNLRVRGDDDKTGLVPGYDSYRMMIPDESAIDFDFSILDTVYADRDYIV